jgi:tetratricopeptide (TPR) repeat protein
MTKREKKNSCLLLFILTLTPVAAPFAADAPTPAPTPASNFSSSANAPDIINANYSRNENAPDEFAQTQSMINELERLGGAYANELGEAYLDMGNLLSAAGEHENALENFDKALQMNRIHNGLSHPSQLSILEAMINNSFAMEAWETADDQINLFWHVASRNFAAGNPERLQALEQLQAWQTFAATNHFLPGMLNAMEDTTRLFEHEIASFANDGLKDLETAETRAALLLGKADLLYQRALLTEAQSLTSFKDGTLKMNMQRQCMPTMQPSGKIAQVCVNTAAPNVGFYVEQTKKRDMVVFAYLNEMKASVLEAYDALMQFDTMSSGKLTMLSRVHGMTSEFNTVAARYQKPLAHDITN